MQLDPSTADMVHSARVGVVDVNDLKKLARTLADERRAQKLRVEDVSERSGYCVDYIMKLECGQATPSFGALTAWAGSLGYDVTLKRKGTT